MICGSTVLYNIITDCLEIRRLDSFISVSLSLTNYILSKSRRFYNFLVLTFWIVHNVGKDTFH